MTDVQTSAERPFLKRLSDWLGSHKQKQEGRSWISRWWFAFLIGSIGLLVFGYLYWRAAQQGKRIAQLLHDRDVTKEELKRTALAQQIETNAATAKALSDKNSQHFVKISHINGELNQVQNEKNKTDKIIDDIKSWRDVDRLLGGDDKTPGG